MAEVGQHLVPDATVTQSHAGRTRSVPLHLATLPVRHGDATRTELLTPCTTIAEMPAPDSERLLSSPASGTWLSHALISAPQPDPRPALPVATWFLLVWGLGLAATNRA
jgi:hypothetical protein